MSNLGFMIHRMLGSVMWNPYDTGNPLTCLSIGNHFRSFPLGFRKMSLFSFSRSSQLLSERKLAVHHQVQLIPRLNIGRNLWYAGNST